MILPLIHLVFLALEIAIDVANKVVCAAEPISLEDST